MKYLMDTLKKIEIDLLKDEQNKKLYFFSIVEDLNVNFYILEDKNKFSFELNCYYEDENSRYNEKILRMGNEFLEKNKKIKKIEEELINTGESEMMTISGPAYFSTWSRKIF